VLYTAIGIGTVVGSLGVASLGDFAYQRQALDGIIAYDVNFCGHFFSLLHLYWVSFTLLVVIGASQTVASALSITLLQLKAPKNMIGIVMSINTLIVMGIRPLGAFPFGALADVIGTSAALAAGALTAAAISIYLFATNSRLRSA
jgi:predicted MFS family arabinose efflux permease